MSDESKTDMTLAVSNPENVVPLYECHGRLICTPERPWQEGDETPVVHPLAREVGEQEDGYPGGDIVTMECPTCGTRWKKELAQ